MVVLSVSQGKLEGGESVTESGYKYYEFLSIPYAKPPVGELRFKNPQAPEPWDGVKNATTSNSENVSCQVNFLTGEVIGSEDCLYLNVYTPIIPSDNSKLLPVMFYIHGGGFIYGSGIMKEQQGPEFLLPHDVVLVVINYRLGILGFMNLDIPEASGNMGLKDQVLALKWVKNNIAKFGGDRDNVTIFGISAGSASVEYLLLSPLAKGLFHKAILQSGSTINDWAINDNYLELTKKLLEILKFKRNTEDNSAIYQFLLEVPAPELAGAAFHAAETFTTKAIHFGFVPSIEKDFGSAFFTTHPYKLLKEGKFTKVPTIKGFCNKEGILMNMMKPFAVNELINKKSFTNFFSHKLYEGDKEKYQTKFTDLYLGNVKEDHDKDNFAVDYFGDVHFSSGVWHSAKMMTNHGVPTYVYLFSYDGNINCLKKSFGIMKKGASHGDDLTYLFSNNFVVSKPNETDILVRSRMTKMWTNFAKTSDPSAPDIPVKWPKFTEENKSFLNIDKEFTIESNYELKRMAVFEEIYTKYGK